MLRVRLLGSVAAFTVALLTIAAPTATAQSSSRKQERERAAKMQALDAQIEQRRAAAPIPDEGTTDMNGVDLHKKRQLEILEARLNGGNVYGAKTSTKDNQYEDASNKGFTVRKFRARKGARQDQRGYSPPAGGIDPPGEPLVKEQRQFFLKPHHK